MRGPRIAGAEPVAAGLLAMLLVGGCTGSTPSGGQASATAQPPATPAAQERPSATSTPPSPTATQPTPAGITEAQALAAVEAFAPNASGLHVVGTQKAWMGPAYRIESKEVLAAVDQATGRVTMFIDNTAIPSTAVVKVTREEATATATSWLADRGVDTAGMAPVTTLLDHGSIQEYQVLWTARLGAVRLPRIVQVSINPETGVVCSFLNNGRSYVDPPAPKLTLEDATAAARAEERDAGANVTSSELVVTFDPAGAQVLVYELRMTRSNGFFVMLDVDALTGAVTVVGRG